MKLTTPQSGIVAPKGPAGSLILWKDGTPAEELQGVLKAA